MVESIESYDQKYHTILLAIEWILTILFTIEYILRLYSSKSAKQYFTSFYGIIDLLSILPTFLSLIFVGTKYLLIIRLLRLLRVFRIFKLVNYMKGRNLIVFSINESFPKIIVFLSFVVTMAAIAGTIMYIVESGHPESGFKNIPLSIYWAIVTLTTVGYGDISPVTPLGQFLAAIIMILGYSVIAVPTGIISVGMNKYQEKLKESESKECTECNELIYDVSAKYCKNCGSFIEK